MKHIDRQDRLSYTVNSEENTRLLRKESNADLQFTGKAKQEAKLNMILRPYLDADMCPRVTGNSYSIGIKLEPMYFSESFAKYADQMETLYDAVTRLQKLAARISEDGKELP